MVLFFQSFCICFLISFFEGGILSFKYNRMNGFLILSKVPDLKFGFLTLYSCWISWLLLCYLVSVLRVFYFCIALIFCTIFYIYYLYHISCTCCNDIPTFFCYCNRHLFINNYNTFNYTFDVRYQNIYSMKISVRIVSDNSISCASLHSFHHDN